MAHAKLAPSAAARWIGCPGSIRLTEMVPVHERDTGNSFSREGTLAHEVCEVMAKSFLGQVDADALMDTIDRWEGQAESEGFDLDEMMQCAQMWISRVEDYVLRGFTVALEQRVDTGVPMSWGTADMVAFNGREVHIIDLKYGRGVRVDAPDNPQLMLYGLGVLEKFAPDAEYVEMTIWQPRIDHESTAVVPADELRQWRDAIAIPAARLALSPDAPIVPSEYACRFCPAAGICSVRMQAVLDSDFGDPAVMDAATLARTLEELDAIEDWCKAVREASLRTARSGTGLPGWKLVRKQGRRRITDPDAAILALGADSVRHSLRPLGELEKLVGGRKKLEDRLGDLIQLSVGSEVLVPADDPRPPSSPGDDF